jgi:serine/threonine-protein kinase
MALALGARLGPYEVLSALGAGGMGEVYRARDTKLNRDVAIKVLPESVANDPERLERFHREAQVLAALNHPNIAHVYGFEDSGATHGLVMELVEGPTLDDRIAQGPIPLNEALPIARQIAEALEAAHEQGIIHRDLKPANIKVQDVGIVKVLDFGLAKLVGPTAAAASHPDVTASPTITPPAVPFAVRSGQPEHGRGMMTREGVILGTPAYMSPEQARGRVADKRSDVWAFGAVLYEMLTGTRAFRGETTTDVLAAVVTAEPDWDKLPASAQPLLRLCLEKDPDRRLRHVGDFERLLEARPAAPHATRVPWSAIVAVLAIVAAGSASWALWRTQRKPPENDSAKTIRFTITPAQLSKGSNTDIDTAVFISSDGKHIAYVESPTGQLWIRDLDQEQARLVPGATGVYEAFWSPDDKTIGYSTGPACMPGTSKVDCGLVKIPVQGGSSVLITKIQGGFRRASWSSDGETIVYCDTTGIYTVPARGGTPTPVVEDPPFLDPGGRPHIEHPSFLDLPDGRRAVLFQAIDARIPDTASTYK